MFLQFKMVRRTFLKLTAAVTAAVARFASPAAQRAHGETAIYTDASQNSGALIELKAIAITIGQVELLWKTPQSAGAVARYDIYRNATLLVTLATSDGAAETYTDATVAQGRIYLYTVIAFNSAGSAVAASLPTKVITPDLAMQDIWPPAPPEGLTATAFPGYILLDWYGGNDDTDITSYLIRRNGLRLVRVDGGTLEFRDTTVRPLRTYIYSIQAIDTMGNRSSWESVTIRTTVAGAAVAGTEGAASDPSQPQEPREIYLPLVLREASHITSDATSKAASTSGTTSSAASVQSVAAYSTNLKRYPYLTDLVGPHVTINWATDDSSTEGYVTYGEVGSEPPTAHTVAATRSSIRVNGVDEYQWKAMLTLTPDTQYAYRIFLGSGTPIDLLGTDPAPTFWTQIPAGVSKVFSFIVVGDWGDASNGATEQASLMALIAQSGALFGFTTGDNSYPSGSQSNYGDLVQTGPSISGTFGPQGWPVAGRSMPLFPVLGNHGFSNQDSAGNTHLLNWPQQRAAQLSSGRYVSEFYGGLYGTTPRNYPSAWYAFEAGVARFYVLEAAWHDSNTGNADSSYEADYGYHWAPGSAQYQWLANDLAANPNKLKFAFFHYPLYTDNNTESSDTYLQGVDSLEGLLTNYGVHLAFNGHAHLFQRNNANGLTSYVLGATGVKVQPLDLGCTSVDQFGLGWSNSKNKGYACGAATVPTSKQQVYNFVKVTVDGSMVTVTPQNSLGQIFDQQVFNFTVGGPLPTPTSVPLTPTPTQTRTPTLTPTGAPATATSTPTPTQTATRNTQPQTQTNHAITHTNW
ncbi:MAG: metallophosphoesterase family protein, partial [Anaerolineae bacterium]|nr:metallophosphoesterase family protein [Anaerolineae bacterium]